MVQNSASVDSLPLVVKEPCCLPYRWVSKLVGDDCVNGASGCFRDLLKCWPNSELFSLSRSNFLK